MARTRVQAIRSNVSGARPSNREPGEIFTNWPDRQIGVVDSGRQPVDLVGVRFFSTAASYTPGDVVNNSGRIYRATAVVAPAVFDPAKWVEIGVAVHIGDAAPASALPAALFWNSATGNLYIRYDDGNSTQWVQIDGGETALPLFSGAGSPEGVVLAPVGALYTRTDGGVGTTLYVKESGGYTGWAAK